ncbi:MAG: Bax inhibitor-1 family protein [Simkaniaceae bacterium]|nr:Bax inhibitor-1 family protein [Candidatus Sacchlamyda saccharinae]
MAEITINSHGPRPTTQFHTRTRFSKEAPKVSEKISKVYAYAALAFAVTCATAFIAERIGFAATILNLSIHLSPVIAPLILTAIAINLAIATIRTPKENTQEKHAFFGAFAVFQGLSLSPAVLINPTAFLAASVATVGVVGGLGALSMTLKESFERYEKIMMVALGAICIASISTLALSGSAALLAHEISLIGGLALFTGLVVYDTHKARSEAQSPFFDEINHALNMYLNAINILIRLWTIFAGNQKK